MERSSYGWTAFRGAMWGGSAALMTLGAITYYGLFFEAPKPALNAGSISPGVTSSTPWNRGVCNNTDEAVFVLFALGPPHTVEPGQCVTGDTVK